MADANESLIALATLAYKFPLPVTKVIEFTECFKRNLGDETTRKAISHLDQARLDMAQEMVLDHPNYQNVVAGADRYVPLIAQVLFSLEQATEPVYLDKVLSFDWATGIGHYPRTSWVTSQAVVWDKCMALVTKALSHADAVHNMVTTGPAKFVDASKELRIAAGIFTALQKEELPRWVGATAQTERLPESTEGVCEALAVLCLAQAQQMAVGKALAAAAAAGEGSTAGVTPPSLLARLCLGVVQQLDQCVTVLKTKAGIMYLKLNDALLKHIAFQKQLYTALAFKFMAQAAWARDAFGVGIADLKAAIAQLSPKSRTNPDGMDPLQQPLIAKVDALTAVRADAAAMLAQFEKDNKTIYYDSIPTEPEALPEPLVMNLKAEPYVQPELTKLLFYESGGKQKAASRPFFGKATDAAASAKSDEELARELQAKLNADDSASA